jgi:hypothetical protein
MAPVGWIYIQHHLWMIIPASAMSLPQQQDLGLGELRVLSVTYYYGIKDHKTAPLSLPESQTVQHRE